jgi:hypothetical protein
MELVPSRRDPECCAACLTTVPGFVQCRAKPTTTRDGYPCCRRHAKARFFEPWTGMTQADAARIFDRIILEQLQRPAPLKLVKT